MKVGIGFANIMQFGTLDGLKELAIAAEGAGFDSLWTVEHVIYPDGYGSTYPYDPSGKMPAAPDTPMPDPLIWLTMVGAHTSTLRLGTGILILPERNPFVLAKTLATIDQLTGGRMELGIGVGWLKEEFEALGIPWARRGARTDEYIEVMRKLWTGELISHDGEFVQCTNVASNPRPVNGDIPIVVGGHSEAAAKRAGRIGNGFFPGNGDLPTLIDIVRQTAADAGRDPAAIEITAGANADLMGSDPVGGAEELAAIGVDRALVPSFLFLKDTADSVAQFGENIVSKVTD